MPASDPRPGVDIAVTRCVSPARLRIPSRISISATENSIARPIRGGITTPKTMITPPTRVMVTVWPMPHRLPIRAALQAVRCRLTIVATAMTWSGSIACRIPRSSPKRMMGRLAIVAASFPPLLGRLCGVEDPVDQARWEVEGTPTRSPPHRRLSVPPRTTSATTSPPLVLDGEGMTSCHPLRPSLQTAPLQERSLRLLLRLEALAHELPAVVTMEVLGRRLVVACLHLLALPRVLPVGRLTVLRRLLCLAALVLMGLAVPLEAIGHELLADVAGQLLVVSLGIAGRH